jgi:hypothetical protein
MTDDDKAAALALAGCTFPVASYNKRFAGDMARIARQAEPVITERQQKTLWKLVYMFRRQIRDRRLIEIAGPIYEAERKASKRPSLDDLQALSEWNEATGSERQTGG